MSCCSMIVESRLTTFSGDESKPRGDRTAGRVRKIPASIAKAFPTGRPMEDQPTILKCNHCKRPVLETAMPRHIESCLNKRQEKQRKKKEAKEARDAAARKEKGQDSEDEDVLDSRTANKTGAGKKRKAIDEGEDIGPNKKKKKKDEAKVKGGKPKAPVDVERQCGVELAQGGQCARSLTCKSHSMGLKRAVPGRSAPYDKLLMEYQRKNQAKLQKAAMDANAPDPDDDSLPSGPIDEDEEKETVVASLARAWGGQPLFNKPPVPLRRRYEYNRMKSMLASALGGRTGLFGSVLGHGSIFGNTRDGDADKKVPTLPHARAMGAPIAGRKPSVAAAVAV